MYKFNEIRVLDELIGVDLPLIPVLEPLDSSTQSPQKPTDSKGSTEPKGLSKKRTSDWLAAQLASKEKKEKVVEEQSKSTDTREARTTATWSTTSPATTTTEKPKKSADSRDTRIRVLTKSIASKDKQIADLYAQLDVARSTIEKYEEVIEELLGYISILKEEKAVLEKEKAALELELEECRSPYRCVSKTDPRKYDIVLPIGASCISLHNARCWVHNDFPGFVWRNGTWYSYEEAKSFTVNTTYEPGKNIPNDTCEVRIIGSQYRVFYFDYPKYYVWDPHLRQTIPWRCPRIGELESKGIPDPNR